MVSEQHTVQHQLHFMTMDEPTYHCLYTDAGPEIVYGTMRDVALLQDAREARRATYCIPLQLDLLYKDIESGVFGEQAKTGMFACYIRDIKKQFPKPKDSE